MSRKRGDVSPGVEEAQGNGETAVKAPLTPEQEAARAERIAKRPRYWLVRIDENGFPRTVLGSFKSGRLAVRKIDEYARVLGSRVADLAVVRVKAIAGASIQV